ncbi:MAG: class I SAM-dependent methyltransferase [Actinomycetota bacterium]|nr:class I SAM-dependent methyltransferase [Actinomycetota bacterium]
MPFDRAAEYYDRTRALPPEAHERVIDLLVSELDSVAGGGVLEVGVGTGRIALSLADRGLGLTGLDLSGPMLDRLAANAGGHPPVRPVRADATRLPFPDDAFDAGVASHVFHLITDWPVALGELARVVRPGGVLLVSRGGHHGALSDLSNVAMEAVDVVLPGADVAEEVDLEAAKLGLTVRMLEPVAFPYRLAPASVLRMIASAQFSWSWALDPERLRLAVDAGRRWASERWDDLDQPVTSEATVVWRAHDVPLA